MCDRIVDRSLQVSDHTCYAGYGTYTRRYFGSVSCDCHAHVPCTANIGKDQKTSQKESRGKAMTKRNFRTFKRTFHPLREVTHVKKRGVMNVLNLAYYGG